MTEEKPNKCTDCGNALDSWLSSQNCDCKEGYDRRFFMNAVMGGRKPKQGASEWSLLEFDGNQWNDSWRWNTRKLLQLDEGQLLGLYQTLNGRRPQ